MRSLKILYDGFNQGYNELGKQVFMTVPNSPTSVLLHRAHELFNLKPNFWLVETTYLMIRHMMQYENLKAILEKEVDIIQVLMDSKDADLLEWAKEFYDFIDEAHESNRLRRDFFVNQIIVGQGLMIQKLFNLITNFLEDRKELLS